MLANYVHRNPATVVTPTPRVPAANLIITNQLETRDDQAPDWNT